MKCVSPARILKSYALYASEVGGPLHLTVDEGEFHRAMRTKCGYRGRPEVVSEIFQTLGA